MAEAMESQTLEDLMNNFHKEIGREKLSNIMQKFSGDETTANMFKSLWAEEQAHKYLAPNLVQSVKSEEEANRLRGLGNDWLVQRDLKNALEMFTKSIMVAPHPKLDLTEEQNGSHSSGKTPESVPEYGPGYEALSLGYGRRSAVLFELQNYDLCLCDIMRANGCPKLQSELEDRSNKCLMLLKNEKNVEQTQGVDDFGKMQLVPKLQDPNPIIPSFSSACKMAYMTEKGRHIIASKNICPGEVILVEKACCASPYLENLSSYCSTCLNECLAPLPCPNCSLVVFCSPGCRQEGLLSYHWLECSILPTIDALKMMPTFSNVYKILGKTSCTQWKATLKKLEERLSKCSPETKGRNENDIFNSADFDMFYSLCTNAADRPCGDLYVKCLIAFVLTKILQMNGRFFVDDFGKLFPPSEDDLLFTGQFLFSNMMKFSCNGNSIYEFKCSMQPFRMIKKDSGSGVYPTFSMINHSCNSNALPYFYGKYYVLRAARTLAVGDEITIGYCRGSYLQPVEDRQIYLDNVYQFECSCEACEGYWPTYRELSDVLRIRCLSCLQGVSEENFSCLNCGFNYTMEEKNESEQRAVKEWKATFGEVKKAYDKLQTLMNAMMAGGSSVKPDLNTIRTSIEVLEKHVPPPSTILWDARDTLELYFHLEKNIKLT